MPFEKGEAIRALQSYGNYLIICGRWETFVLSGTNEQTWNLRELGKLGAIGPQSITEHRGLVYFMSPTGKLGVTDGTSMDEAPGFDKVREWIKDRIDQLMLGIDNFNWYPTIESYGPFILISLPDNDGTDYTIAYHPETQSFYLLDIPILDMTVGEQSRAQRLYFSTATTAAASQRPTVFQYKDDPGNEVYTDDDWQAVSATPSTFNITWRWRSAWFKFGSTFNERRLRRVWALITGEPSQAVDVDVYRNFEEGTARTTANRTMVGTAQAEYVEGKVGTTTLHSVGMRLSQSSNAQLSIHGVGLDTEPVRGRRFHRDYTAPTGGDS